MKPTHTNTTTGQPLAALKITVFVAFPMLSVTVAYILEDQDEHFKPTRKQVEKQLKELAGNRGESWFDWYEYGDDAREGRAIEIARELFPDFITP